MWTDVEIDRALAAVTSTLNDQKVEHFDAERVRQIITGSLGGQDKFAVDSGGGIHDETGARVGVVRRTNDRWLAERQSDVAHPSDTAVPGKPTGS